MKKMKLIFDKCIQCLDLITTFGKGLQFIIGWIYMHILHTHTLTHAQIYKEYICIYIFTNEQIKKIQPLLGNTEM